MRPHDVLKHPRTKRILGIAGGLLVLWAAVEFFVLPRFLRTVVERKISERLHRPVTLRRLSINPFALSATLEGLDVKDPGGGPFVSFGSLYLNLEASSVIRGGPVLSAIRLSKPLITIVRLVDGRYNFQDLLDEATKPKPDAGPPKGERPPSFSLNNIEVDGGSIDFDDRPKQTKHAIRDLRIGIPFLSNIPSKVQVTTQPVFEATVNGSPLGLHGTTKPFSETRETTLELDLTDVDLPYYLAYIPNETQTKLLLALMIFTKGGVCSRRVRTTRPRPRARASISSWLRRK